MSAQRHMLSTFDAKPTHAGVGAKPDELMINCATLPKGARASLYMPGARADEILTLAAGINGYQPFGRVDAHTIEFSAAGIAYVPLPRAPGNLAGLIDIVLPEHIRTGDRITLTFNQLTNQSARIPTGRGREKEPETAEPTPRRPTRTIAWRRVTGTFKLALKVKPVAEALPEIERNLSLLRWIFEMMPRDSRWYPIFERYLGAVAGQVAGLGGDPDKIPPTGTGQWPGGPGSAEGGANKPGRERGDHGILGKIEGLIFDHFGDFEGFILETEWDDRLHFYSREKNLQAVVERAWAARLRVTVIPEPADEHHPRRIILHP